MPDREPPIFILAHARTGSTLLRYVLDSHPSIASPSEIEIGKLCAAMHHAVALTLGKTGHWPTPAARRAAMHEMVRRKVLDLMEEYCAAKGRRRWCDKSISNATHLLLLTQLFPDAQYICLHRHALDVAQSCLTAFQFGYPGRLGEFVRESPHNVLDAIIASWNERTRQLLDFEASRAGQCLRIRYEDLVADPRRIVATLCDYLGEPVDDTLADRALRDQHDGGPGDTAILATRDVHRDAVGKGLLLPVSLVSARRLSEMNALLHTLGFEAVSPAPTAPALTGVVHPLLGMRG